MARCAATLLVVLLHATGACCAELPSASEDDVLALRSRVQAGDRGAIRELLSLEVDGAAAEDVAITMGGLITRDPIAFLSEMAGDRRAQCCIDSFLGALGENFVDDGRRQIEELRKRRDALRSVQVPTLRALRDRCVSLIEMQIASMTLDKSLERSRDR